MINPCWLELTMSRTNFHGPKDVEPLEFNCMKTYDGNVWFSRGTNQMTCPEGPKSNSSAILDLVW